jgi:hypothetical protein
MSTPSSNGIKLEGAISFFNRMVGVFIQMSGCAYAPLSSIYSSATDCRMFAIVAFI